MRRPRVLVSVLLCCLLVSAGGTARAADKTAELMAAYIYNFARFVEWPAGQFPNPHTPLVLCTPDADALGGQLLRIHGRQAQNRAMVVRVVAPGEDLAGCQMLFLPAHHEMPVEAWLAAAAGKPLLTISDAAAFTRRGGMIGLFLDVDRVHFDIGRVAVQEAGLRVDSRLLVLARRAPGGGR